jgi:hypothetical protein
LEDCASTTRLGGCFGRRCATGGHDEKVNFTFSLPSGYLHTLECGHAPYTHYTLERAPYPSNFSVGPQESPLTMIRANLFPGYALWESATTNTSRTRHRVSNVTTWLWSGGEYFHSGLYKVNP